MFYCSRVIVPSYRRWETISIFRFHFHPFQKQNASGQNEEAENDDRNQNDHL